MALIIGTNGNDAGTKMLVGTNSADVIYGLAGNDLIFGNGGNDFIFTGSGFDTVRAGTGDDTVYLDSAQGNLDGEGGNDTLVVTYATTNASTFDLAAGTGQIGYALPLTIKGFENITTGTARDTVYGTEGRNLIDTGDGHDTVFARGGNDEIRTGAGNDTVNGGSGNDLIHAGAGNDRFDGGADFDTLTFAGGKAVTVDLIAGTARTGAGDVDTILNIEAFVGSSNADTFIGGAAAADFFGGNGDDSFYSGKGANFIDGGNGDDDWVHYDASPSDVFINLATGTASGGHATGDRLVNVENVFASNGDDQLTGNAKDNTLYGLAGSDHLSGGGGKDVLLGGAGKDYLTGGAGADTFYFTSEDAGSRDVITDFQRGLDTIYLAMDANADKAGMNEFTRLTHLDSPETSAAFTAGTINVRHEGQKTIVELNTSDELVYGRDVAEYSIELAGRIDLHLTDFML